MQPSDLKTNDIIVCLTPAERDRVSGVLNDAGYENYPNTGDTYAAFPNIITYPTIKSYMYIKESIVRPNRITSIEIA